jgi:hypothetical protein
MNQGCSSENDRSGRGHERQECYRRREHEYLDQKPNPSWNGHRSVARSTSISWNVEDPPTGRSDDREAYSQDPGGESITEAEGTNADGHQSQDLQDGSERQVDRVEPKHLASLQTHTQRHLHSYESP